MMMFCARYILLFYLTCYDVFFTNANFADWRHTIMLKSHCFVYCAHFVSHLQVTLSDSTNLVDCSPDDVLMVNINVKDLSPIFDPMDYSESIDEGTGVDTSVVQVMIMLFSSCLTRNLSPNHNTNRKTHS